MTKKQARAILLEAGFLSRYSGKSKTFYISHVGDYNMKVLADFEDVDDLVISVQKAGFTISH